MHDEKDAAHPLTCTAAYPVRQRSLTARLPQHFG